MCLSLFLLAFLQPTYLDVEAETTTQTGPQMIGDPRMVETLWTAFSQNRQSFATLRVSIEWIVKILPEERESLKREIAWMKRKMSKLTTPLTPKERKLLEDDIQDKERLANRDNKDVAPERIQFTVGSGGMEVRIELPAADRRMVEAKKEGIASRTGGDFTLCKHDGGEKWRCLEPYPLIKTKTQKLDIPVGHGRSELVLNCTLPPLIPHKHIHATLDPLDEFWGPRDRVKHLGQLSARGMTQEILVRPADTDDGGLWVVAIHPSFHGNASWVAKCVLSRRSDYAATRQEMIDGKRPDLIREIFERVEFLRDGSSVKRMDAIAAIHVTYYDSVKETTDAGWYPRTIRFCYFGPIRTAATPADAEPIDLPIGPIEEDVLAVKSIEGNFDLPKDAFVLEYPQGTTYLDRDTQQGGIIGVSVEDSLRSVTPLRKWKPWSLLLTTNIALVIVVLSTYGFRRYLKTRSQSPSL